MANPVKIFELKGSDWMKGLSLQSNYAIGGLFATASNFDPFEKMGYFQPSLAPVQIDGTTITTKIKQFAPFQNGGDGYAFGICDGTGAASKTLYRIKLTDSTVVDYSDKIDQNTTPGTIAHNGCVVYKGRLIYEQGGSIRSNLLTPTIIADTNILTSALTNATTSPVIFAQGSDGVLYFTANTGASLGKIVLTTGTTGNTATAFSLTDTTMVPKDICNDGVYTIFIADNNEYKITTTSTVCRIYFWDTIKTKADYIYDIPDAYLLSCKYVDNKVYILGSKGLWVCNSVTPPRLIVPMSSSILPSSASAVTTSGNYLVWASSSIGGKVYAYGASIGKPILFQPNTTNGSDNLNVALTSSGIYFIASTDAGTNTAKAWLLNSGSTRNNSTIVTCTTPLTTPYTLYSIKVSLLAPLSSGQEVYMSVLNGNGGIISNTDSRLYSVVGAKQTFTFTIKPNASFRVFEDIYLQFSSIGGAVIQRVTVYGVPTDDNSQII